MTERPSDRVYQLAAVKDSIYHPKLPTFRRMDIDTGAHKLAEDHCRTTTACRRRHFENASITLYKPHKKPLSVTSVTETGREMIESGKDILKTSAASDNKLVSGYCVRYLSPTVATSWKMSLKQEPNLDRGGQRPIPTNVSNRYRCISSP